MLITPFDSYTTDELVTEVCLDDKATQREIELVERIERLIDDVEFWKGEAVDA